MWATITPAGPGPPLASKALLPSVALVSREPMGPSILVIPGRVYSAGVR